MGINHPELGVIMRREFSKATRRAAWERANGRCEGHLKDFPDGEWLRCYAPIDIGLFHYDHVIPTWISDDDSLENCSVLCVPCHKSKTKKDIKDISKIKRIKDKRIKAKTAKRPMPGSRASGIKKKFDGSVVRR